MLHWEVATLDPETEDVLTVWQAHSAAASRQRRQRVSFAKELAEVLEQRNDPIESVDEDLSGSDAEIIVERNTSTWSRMEPLQVIFFLQALGYPIHGTEDWRNGHVPKAQFHVAKHEEVSGHTMYTLDCTLCPQEVGESALEWKVTKRLRHLRLALHDIVKTELGKNYKQHFSKTPFARRLGPPGTTKRLDAWCANLGFCLSAGLLKPATTASILQLLEVPNPCRK